MPSLQPSLYSLIVIGIVAGWLAGLVLKGRSLGFLGNVVAGLAGAFVGSRVMHLFGISIHSFFGLLVVQFLGAVAVLGIIGLIRGLIADKA